MTMRVSSLQARFIYHNSEQPGLELFRRCQLRQMGECFEHGFLDSIFRVRMIAQENVSGEIESPFIRSHQVMKELALTLQDARNQTTVLIFFVQVGSRYHRRQNGHK